jgi:hypothetical protein
MANDENEKEQDGPQGNVRPLVRRPDQPGRTYEKVGSTKPVDSKRPSPNRGDDDPGPTAA